MPGAAGSTGIITWSAGASFGGSFGPSTYSFDILSVPSGVALGNAARLYVALAFSLSPSTDVSIFNTSYGLYFVDSGGTEYRFSTAFQGLSTPGSISVVTSQHAVIIENGSVNPFGGWTTLGIFPPVGTINQGGTIRLRGNAPSTPPSLDGALVAMIYDQGLLVTPFWNVINFFENAFTSLPIQIQLDTTNTPVSFSGDLVTTQFNTGSREVQLITTDTAGRADTSPAPAPSVALFPDWIDVITEINGDLYASLGMYTGALTGVVPIYISLPRTYYGYLAYSDALGNRDAGGFTIVGVGFGTRSFVPSAAVGSGVGRRSIGQVVG